MATLPQKEDGQQQLPKASLPLLSRNPQYDENYQEWNEVNRSTPAMTPMSDLDDAADLLLTPSDLESPGNLSQGGQSLGGQSSVTTTSDRSTHSRAHLLPVTDRKKDYIKDEQIGEDWDEDEHTCHIGKFRPRVLQSCANIKMFLFLMCMLELVATSLTTGYLNSVITTIEKRFEIGSSISGLIAASYELGNMMAILFVSYLGASRHIPWWIGSGVLLMGLGSLSFSLPHVIAPKYTVGSGIKVNETGDNICQAPGDLGQMGEMCIEENSGNWLYVMLLLGAQLLIGIGGSPIMTLGQMYVDSHVEREKGPVYLAFIHASGALGPVLGYAMGALLLQFYVDSFSFNTNLTPSSPQWIGAWWGGFIICGLLLIVLAFPFLSFPRVLVKERRKIMEAKTKETLIAEQEEAEDKMYGKSIKEIPRAIWGLLRNPIYAMMLPAISCEISIVSGFVVFLPKYIETQFGTSTSLANLFTGGIGIPGAVIGILMGGYILKRLSLTPKGAIQFVLVLNTLAICGLSLFFILGCDNNPIAGANIPYFNSTGHQIFEANLTSICNQNCDCSPNNLQPICGINGITYFSPCHAGCTGSNHFYTPDSKERSFNYSDCSCISYSGLLPSGDHEVIISPMATSGACKNHCDRLLPFLILLVFITFAVAGTQMPLLMITLRSVKSKERSFAIGMQQVVIRIFAYIPSPVYFGNAIDSSCLLWNVKCQRNGSCLLYDIVLFRYAYVGIAGGLKIVSLLFFIAVWWLIRKKSLREESTTNIDDPPVPTAGPASRDNKAQKPVSPRPSQLPIPHPTSPGRNMAGDGILKNQGGQLPDVQFSKLGGLDGRNSAGESVL